MIWCGSGSTFDVWTAIIGSNRNARSIRLASHVSWKRRTVAIKRPRTFDGGDAEVRFVGATKQPFLRRAVRRAIEDLNRTVADRHDSSDRGQSRRLQADKRQSRFEVFEFQHGWLDFKLRESFWLVLVRRWLSETSVDRPV